MKNESTYVLMRTLTSIVLIFLLLICVNSYGQRISIFTQKIENTNIIIGYLKGLEPESRGKVLSGVTLTFTCWQIDDCTGEEKFGHSIVFSGYIFVGKVDTKDENLNIFLLRDKKKKLLAIIKVNDDEDENNKYYIPECKKITYKNIGWNNIYPFRKKGGGIGSDLLNVFNCPPKIWEKYLHLNCRYIFDDELKGKCYKSRITQIDNKLNSVYKKILSRTKNKIQFKKIQRKWINEYRNKVCGISTTNNNWVNSIKNNSDQANCVYRTTQDRTRELLRTHTIRHIKHR